MTASTSSAGNWALRASQYTLVRISMRSPKSFTYFRRRGSISLYQTSASYFSVKHWPELMAFCRTALSSGSCCRSAKAPGAARARERRAAAKRRSGTLHPGTQETDRIVEREVPRFGVTAAAIRESPGLQAAIGDHHAVRNTQQLCVGEFDAGACIAIIEQHFDASRSEVTIQTFAHLSYALGFLQIDGHKYHVERCQRLGPDDAALIVILLDGRGYDARHTDAVATHQEADLTALFVEHPGVHGLAVFAPELKDMADLDTARDLEAAATARAWIAGHHVAKIDDLRLGQIASPVHSGEMRVGPIGAAHEIAELRSTVIRIDLAFESHRTD